MRIPLHVSVLALGLVTLTGCRDEPPPSPRMSEAMPNLPIPPLATVVGRAGGDDALQITFRSTLSPDSMADYYRRVLTSGEWNLMSDTRNRDGSIALYAERKGPPLWVTIRRDSTGAGTLLTLGGAVTREADSAAAVDTTKRS